MSIKIMTLVWDAADVRGSELLVLLALADFANDEGGSIYPSMTTLAHKARLSESQTRRIVQKLAEQGLIEIVRAGGWEGNRNLSNEYRIVVEGLREGGGNLTPPPSRPRDHPPRAHATTPLAPTRPDPPYNRAKKPPLKDAPPTQGRKGGVPADLMRYRPPADIDPLSR